HRSVRLVVLVGLAIDQIAQSGLSSLSVIYYSAQLFSSGASILASKNTSLPFSLLCITPPVNVKTKLARQNDMKCYLAHIL
ncbi:hypothetical protein M2E47_27580, partial [Klebsiella pneumoniae]|nr:hypothetical protein [Klebsiella pneumoniae]